MLSRSWTSHTSVILKVSLHKGVLFATISLGSRPKYNVPAVNPTNTNTQSSVVLFECVHEWIWFTLHWWLWFNLSFFCKISASLTALHLIFVPSIILPKRDNLFVSPFSYTQGNVRQLLCNGIEEDTSSWNLNRHWTVCAGTWKC